MPLCNSVVVVLLQLQYGEPVIRRAVPLALALLSASNPQLSIIDTLSKLSHDNDAEVAHNSIFAMGIVGAGAFVTVALLSGSEGRNSRKVSVGILHKILPNCTLEPLFIRVIERFSYDLEIARTKQIQTRVAFGWLSERSGEKTLCPRTF